MKLHGLQMWMNMEKTEHVDVRAENEDLGKSEFIEERLGARRTLAPGSQSDAKVPLGLGSAGIHKGAAARV